MRVGLLTHHWVRNFGANLQALATSRYLAGLGHDVSVLNYRPQSLEARYGREIPPAQAAAHEEFCATFLRQTPVLRTEDDLAGCCRERKLEAIVVGSDAVFRLDDSEKTEDVAFPNPFWLRWLGKEGGVPRAGYLAASAMGSWLVFQPRQVRRVMQETLRRVDYVSVRDRWTRWMIAGVTAGRLRPDLCPDPVSQLEHVKDVPDALRVPAELGSSPYVLISVNARIFPDGWIREFVRAAHARGLRVVSLPLPDAEVSLPVDHVVSHPLPPLTWYSWIAGAAGFLGIRFHPVACCVFNGVPFLALDSYRTGQFRIHPRLTSKTYDLCASAGMPHRCIPAFQARNLAPARALEVAASAENTAQAYRQRARADFAACVDRLLGNAAPRPVDAGRPTGS